MSMTDHDHPGTQKRTIGKMLRCMSAPWVQAEWPHQQCSLTCIRSAREVPADQHWLIPPWHVCTATTAQLSTMKVGYQSSSHCQTIQMRLVVKMDISISRVCRGHTKAVALPSSTGLWTHLSLASIMPLCSLNLCFASAFMPCSSSFNSDCFCSFAAAWFALSSSLYCFCCWSTCCASCLSEALWASSLCLRSCT